jgi:hypothetical protein
MTNMYFWDMLRTVPKDAQKPFTRASGFKGTAINPMWTIKTMTEIFGPCGIGWGIGKPEFTTVPADDELLVYCTVAVWYLPPVASGPGLPASQLVGVGGDKVLTKQCSGMLFSDDEAFKKAFTDALTNALKTLGAGADIYMGVHDSNKYVGDPADRAPPTKAENYLKWAAGQIAAFETKDQLLTWWAGEKQARSDHMLTQEHVDTLKTVMLKRFPTERTAATCQAGEIHKARHSQDGNPVSRTRREFTAAVKMAAWTRAGGKCEKCGLPFGGRRPEYHHNQENFFGGTATLENCLCICPRCHKYFTSQAVPRMAKTRMQEKAAAGIKPTGRPMPGSRASPYKQRLTSRGVRTENRT